MALVGLSAGLTWSDMRAMKYTEVVQIVREYAAMHGSKQEYTRDATPDDVEALKRL